MMTRVLLTFLVGLVVSLGTLVSGVDPVLAKNWNLSKEEKERGEFLSFNDERLCLAATGRGGRVKQWDKNPKYKKYVNEAKRRGLSCGVIGTSSNEVAKAKKDVFGVDSNDLIETYLGTTVPKSTSSSQIASSTSKLSESEIVKKKIASYGDTFLCELATKHFTWETQRHFQPHVEEAKRRGLTCGVNITVETKPLIIDPNWIEVGGTANYGNTGAHLFFDVENDTIYFLTRKDEGGYFDELVNHFLDPQNATDGQIAVAFSAKEPASKGHAMIWKKIKFISVLKMSDGHRILKIEGVNFHDIISNFNQTQNYYFRARVTRQNSKYPTRWRGIWLDIKHTPVREAAFLKLSKEVEKYYTLAVKATATCKELGFTIGTSKHDHCVFKLSGKSVSQGTATPAQQQKTIVSDTQVPLITITQSGADGRKGLVKGYAKDNVQVAEVLIEGQAVRVGNDGSFEWSGFVPATGKEITIEAIDTAALSSTQVISLKRGQIQQASGPRFDVLDPTAGKKVKRNSNALALIVGISDYKRTDAPAVYADKDAQYFHDYASLKLGISDNNIKTMVNAKAEQGDVILAVKDWMRRSSKPGKTDVYVFFAGHGLASQDGEQMYLLPYDGRPRLLDDTAILRDRLFSDIASANPRSVTVFLDTCYSGTTRGTDMLIASRPIAIKALKQSVPDNFTVMTAAAGDQTAKPLEEAKHGMFSYFLMKGMEGEADKNSDNKITAGELHSYVQQNVVQQSSGSQTPELQGDAERVLVRFQ